MKDSLKKIKVIVYLVNNDQKFSKKLYDLKPKSELVNKLVKLSTRIYGLAPLSVLGVILTNNVLHTLLGLVFIVIFNSIIVEGILKNIIKRKRPSFNEKSLHTYSFPSTHATSVTMAFWFYFINLQSYNYQSLLLTLSLIWCLYVILSRVVYGHHYLFDVFFGFILASLFSVGFIFTKFV